MNARELLKEASYKLKAYYGGNPSDGRRALAIINDIDAYLAEPAPDAMELVMKLRHMNLKRTEYGYMVDSISDEKAAALIEDYGRRVPRAMLEEIFDNGYQAGELMGDYEDVTSETKNFEAIAAKYGVQVEDAK